MHLKELMEGVEYCGELKDVIVSDISYDSRSISESSLFFAISGNQFDGHDYIQDAIQNGAIAILTEKKIEIDAQIPILIVKDIRYVMSKISNKFFGNPSSKIYVAGVTGTNGKTTTVHIINQILNSNNCKCASIGTLGLIINSTIKDLGHTTPESVELHRYLNDLHENKVMNVAMEVSSHSLALDRVSHLAIDTAIYTNLSPEHLDFHEDMDSYFNEKLKMFMLLKETGHAIINIDDEYSHLILKKIKSNIITYGMSSNADIHPIEYELDYEKMSITFSIFDKKYTVETKMTGEFNVYNIMAAIGSCMAKGIKVEKIINSIKNISRAPGRLEFIGNNSKKVFIDYAHTTDSFTKVFSFIDSMKKDNHKIYGLFGCGGDRDKSKRPEMAKIAEKYCQKVFITTDNPRTENINSIINDICDGFVEKKHKIIINREDAINQALDELDENTILVVFGKGRENYQIVGKKVLEHNDVEIIERNIYEN